MKTPIHPCLGLALSLCVAAAPGSQVAQGTEMRVMLYRLAKVQPGRESEAWRCIKDLSEYVAQHHGQEVVHNYFGTTFGDASAVYAFNECQIPIEAVFAGYSNDTQWQRLFEAYEATHVQSVPQNVLVPVAGRRSAEPRLYRELRVARARIEGFGRAMRAARELTEYVNTKHPEAAAQLYVQQLEAFGVCYWLTDYADLTTWERIAGELVRDDAYLALFDKMNDTFVDGSVETQVIERL